MLEIREDGFEEWIEFGDENEYKSPWGMFVLVGPLFGIICAVLLFFLTRKP